MVAGCDQALIDLAHRPCRCLGFEVVMVWSLHRNYIGQRRCVSGVFWEFVAPSLGICVRVLVRVYPSKSHLALASHCVVRGRRCSPLVTVLGICVSYCSLGLCSLGRKPTLLDWAMGSDFRRAGCRQHCGKRCDSHAP